MYPTETATLRDDQKIFELFLKGQVRRIGQEGPL